MLRQCFRRFGSTGNRVGDAPRIPLDDCPHEVGRRLQGRTDGMLAAEEDVQEHAERIHVGRGGDLSAGHLLRRRVLGRERRSAIAGQRARLGGLRMPPLGIPLEQLGDPEVEQLDLPIDPDQHVGRLDVAVHDQVGVRVGDSLQHIEEQAETGLDSQRMFAAVTVDAEAVHVLEHEVRLARRRHSRIDEVRDVRVGEPGENVALAPEPLFAGAPQQREVQQLDRRAPFEAAVAALGQPHAAHAALTDPRDQAVRTEGLPLQRRQRRARQRNGLFQKM